MINFIMGINKNLVGKSIEHGIKISLLVDKLVWICDWSVVSYISA